MNLFDIIRLSAENAEPQELTGFAAFFYQYGSIIMLVLVFVVMYFLMIRPQQKKQIHQKIDDQKRIHIDLQAIPPCPEVLPVYLSRIKKAVATGPEMNRKFRHCACAFGTDMRGYKKHPKKESDIPFSGGFI